MGNRLPTEDEYKRFLEAMETAREYYRNRQYQEGWAWVLEHKHLFPQERLDELFVKFSEKIFNLKA